MVEWKIKESPEKIKWTARRKIGLDKELWGVVTLYKYHTLDTYNIEGKCYATKLIGIDKSSRALIKVYKDRWYDVKKYSTAKKRATMLKKEISKIMDNYYKR